MTASSCCSTVARTELDALLGENRELRAVNEDLQVVAYAIAHDLRSPLRAIDGYAHALEEDLGAAPSATVAHDLNAIKVTIGRMQTMLTQWLSLLQKPHAELQPHSIDLSELAESVAQEIRIGHPEREVTVNIQPGLSAVGDSILVRELLQNLLGNAWKFTQQKPDARIDIGAYRDREQTVYFVRDNGVGFSELDKQRLFRPFVRLHHEKCYIGSGVGLAIAHRIVERHGGRIWVQALPDLGATFKFTLGNAAVSHPSRSAASNSEPF